MSAVTGRYFSGLEKPRNSCTERRSTQSPGAGAVSGGFLEVAPELVVEVRSPDETRKDVEEKMKEYLAIGVRWVWYFDPKIHSCAVHSSNKGVQKLAENDVLIGEEILTGLEIKLSALFRD